MGPRTYNFIASNQGKTTFSNIKPDKSTITVRSSACGGSMNYTKKLTGKETLKAFVRW
jgi:hypothetical protein